MDHHDYFDPEELSTNVANIELVTVPCLDMLSWGDFGPKEISTNAVIMSIIYIVLCFDMLPYDKAIWQT